MYFIELLYCLKCVAAAWDVAENKFHTMSENELYLDLYERVLKQIAEGGARFRNISIQLEQTRNVEKRHPAEKAHLLRTKVGRCLAGRAWQCPDRTLL